MDAFDRKTLVFLVVSGGLVAALLMTNRRVTAIEDVLRAAVIEADNRRRQWHPSSSQYADTASFPNQPDHVVAPTTHSHAAQPKLPTYFPSMSTVDPPQTQSTETMPRSDTATTPTVTGPRDPIKLSSNGPVPMSKSFNPGASVRNPRL